MQTTMLAQPTRRAVVAQPIVRVFMFKGMTLQDPLPGKSTKAVRAIHALQYAQIATAKIDGPAFAGNQEVYTYIPATGTNG